MESDIQFHKWQRLTCIFAKLCPHCSSNGRATRSRARATNSYVTELHENTRTCSFSIMASSPSYTIKIYHQSPCDSHCHQCLLSMENIALFQQSVTHRTALQTQKSGRDTQRSPADRTKTYCALRRSSEEWATYWFHPPWFAHSEGIAISIQGQQSCFKSHLNRVRFLSLSGFVNENCCRRKHIMSLLRWGDREQTAGHCCRCIDCTKGHSKKSIRPWGKGSVTSQTNALIYNEWH